MKCRCIVVIVCNAFDHPTRLLNTVLRKKLGFCFVTWNDSAGYYIAVEWAE